MTIPRVASKAGGEGPKAPGVQFHGNERLVRIGVLAVQGNFREHVAMLRRLGADVVEVRRPEQLEGLDGLVVPGGESTAIRRLMRVGGLEEPVAAFPGPLFGTCAGMILFDRAHLGLIDVEVERNAYGRQVASFEADVELEGDPSRSAASSSAPRGSPTPGRTSRCSAGSRASPCSCARGASSPPRSTPS